MQYITQSSVRYRAPSVNGCYPLLLVAEVGEAILLAHHATGTAAQLSW